MEITREKLDKLYAIYDELDVLTEEASLAINAAKSHGERTITVKRKDGTEQQVTEKLLWDELWELGKQSEAGQALRARYPEAFAKSDAQEEKLRELKAFTVLELEVDAQQITLRDILRIAEAVAEYKLHGNDQRKEDGTA